MLLRVAACGEELCMRPLSANEWISIKHTARVAPPLLVSPPQPLFVRLQVVTKSQRLEEARAATVEFAAAE